MKKEKQRIYFADPDMWAEDFYISYLTDEQLKYIKINFGLENDKDGTGIIDFDYLIYCPTDIDLREYLNNEGFKEVIETVF
jgi:hypothetical protein